MKTKTERGVNLLHIARNITLCGGGFVAIKVFHFALKCRTGTFEIAEYSKTEQIIMKHIHQGADARKRVSSDGQATPRRFMNDIELFCLDGEVGRVELHLEVRLAA